MRNVFNGRQGFGFGSVVDHVLGVFNVSLEFSGIGRLLFFRGTGSRVNDLVFSVGVNFIGEVFSKFVSVVQSISERSFSEAFLGVFIEFVASGVGQDDGLIFSDGVNEVTHFAKDFIKVIFSGGFQGISDEFVLRFNSVNGLLGSVNLFLYFFCDGFDGFDCTGSLVCVGEVNGEVDLDFDCGVGLFLIVEGS